MSRDTLHHLIDRLPDAELPAAQRFLEYLATNAAYRTAQCAPEDDEPVTDADAEVVSRVRDEVRDGKVVSHDEVLREFGLREIRVAAVRTIRPA